MNSQLGSNSIQFPREALRKSTDERSHLDFVEAERLNLLWFFADG